MVPGAQYMLKKCSPYTLPTHPPPPNSEMEWVMRRSCNNQLCSLGRARGQELGGGSSGAVPGGQVPRPGAVRAPECGFSQTPVAAVAKVSASMLCTALSEGEAGSGCVLLLQLIYPKSHLVLQTFSTYTHRTPCRQVSSGWCFSDACSFHLVVLPSSRINLAAEGRKSAIVGQARKKFQCTSYNTPFRCNTGQHHMSPSAAKDWKVESCCLPRSKENQLWWSASVSAIDGGKNGKQLLNGTNCFQVTLSKSTPDCNSR